MMMEHNVNGVRYRRLDSGGRILQVRIASGENQRWLDVREAMACGIVPESCSRFKKQYSEPEAKIARVELMETLGLDIADGICLAYAGAKQECLARRKEKQDSQKRKSAQIERRSLTRSSKWRRKHVVTDDELRTYKPGIFGVFCPAPVNKLARDVIAMKRKGTP